MSDVSIVWLITHLTAELYNELHASVELATTVKNSSRFVWGLECKDMKFVGCTTPPFPQLDIPTCSSNYKHVLQNGKLYASSEFMRYAQNRSKSIFYTPYTSYTGNRRYLTISKVFIFLPLINLGIKKALLLDTDAYIMNNNALNILNYNTPFVVARRCNYKYADRYNMSHPNVKSKNIKNRFNSGVLGFPNLLKWCSIVNERFYSLKILNEKQTREGNLVINVKKEDMSEQNLLNIVFSDIATFVSGKYNFRPISGDSNDCSGINHPIMILHDNRKKHKKKLQL